ncbi:hypothetical protein N7465_011483 [Penicillium sp. CMV-2018d]|nr:hypothetical protein N7465_011483 [Penicillium sp. CMV-2018d]
MNMIDLIYVKYSPKWCCALECGVYTKSEASEYHGPGGSGPCTSRNSHLRPPSVQAESCVHPSTRISLGATISSLLKSNVPAILVKLSKPPPKS